MIVLIRMMITIVKRIIMVMNNYDHNNDNKSDTKNNNNNDNNNQNDNYNNNSYNNNNNNNNNDNYNNDDNNNDNNNNNNHNYNNNMPLGSYSEGMVVCFTEGQSVGKLAVIQKNPTQTQVSTDLFGWNVLSSLL